VFLKPSPIRLDSQGISIGYDPLGGKFIGIIGEYILYQDIAISTAPMEWLRWLKKNNKYRWNRIKNYNKRKSIPFAEKVKKIMKE